MCGHPAVLAAIVLSMLVGSARPCAAGSRPSPDTRATQVAPKPALAAVPRGSWALVARYYAPVTGRFISRDPAWDPMNMGNPYTGFANNPVTYRDPSGKAIPLLLMAGIAAFEMFAIDQGVQHYTGYSSGVSTGRSLGESAGLGLVTGATTLATGGLATALAPAGGFLAAGGALTAGDVAANVAASVLVGIPAEAANSYILTGQASVSLRGVGINALFGFAGSFAGPAAAALNRRFPTFGSSVFRVDEGVVTLLGRRFIRARQFDALTYDPDIQAGGQLKSVRELEVALAAVEQGRYAGPIRRAEGGSSGDFVDANGVTFNVKGFHPRGNLGTAEGFNGFIRSKILNRLAGDPDLDILLDPAHTDPRVLSWVVDAINRTQPRPRVFAPSEPIAPVRRLPF